MIGKLARVKTFYCVGDETNDIFFYSINWL